MKIGVISDTHQKWTSHLLERVNDTAFRDVGLVIHAGDLTTLDVLKAFRGKEIIAVSGNNDSSEVRRELESKRVIQIKHFKIGLIHGWGWPWGLQKRIATAFDGIDCLVYGHSHWAVNRRRNRVLYFNPGAFTGGLPSLWRRTVGILSIDHEIHGEIIRV